jgi:general nucleoside transport system ATP-binding protein
MTDEWVHPGSAPGAPVLAARAIVKRFPGVLALGGVDFELRSGEVHTLLGENGAGKSTLASVLCGAYQPDGGSVLRHGRPVELRSPRDGLAHGIAMVHQHFRLVERFTVSENVVLGDPRLGRWVSRRRIDDEVARVGEQFGLPVDPTARVNDLSVGQRQRVEIVKALYRGADVLLLDEPTAVLTPQETEALFVTVRSMTAAGKSVVFISHKLGEVVEISDRVTVMRGGVVTGEVAERGADRHELARLMVGRDIDLDAQRFAAGSTGQVCLVARGVTLRVGEQTVLDDINFEVRSGEIVGIAGVSGNGQRELADVLCGVTRPSSGVVEIDGAPVHRGREAREAGSAYIPEERLGTGLAPSLSIAENLLLTRRRRALISRSALRTEAEHIIDEFEVKATGPDALCRSLSGGNAQKVLVARELAGDGRTPKVVVAAAPTRGLDVGAIEQVRTRLDQARRAGAGVVLISEDLDEVLAMSDRVVVLYRGRISYEGSGGSSDREAIGRAMAGVG